MGSRGLSCDSVRCHVDGAVTRDFKIGLICGAVLAFIALIWVVTRPTLSPQARMTAPPTDSAPKTRIPELQPQTSQASPSESTPSEPPFEASIPADPVDETPAPGTEPPAFEPEITEPIQTAQADSTTDEQDPNATVRYHVVRKDETLSSISQLYYGTPNQWRRIVQANTETIEDANRISPGTRIAIPE